MRRSNHGWSNDQDNYLMNQIKSNPSNITATLHVVSNTLDKSFTACRQRYYTLNKTTTVIAVAGSSGIVHKNKNAPRRQVVPDATSVRDAMLYASFEKLSKEKAIKFLLSNLSDQAKANLLIRIANKVVGQ